MAGGDGTVARALVDEYAGRLAPSFVRAVLARCQAASPGSVEAAVDLTREQLDEWLRDARYPEDGQDLPRRQLGTST